MPKKDHLAEQGKWGEHPLDDLQRGCLVGHPPEWREGDGCAYRWQAYQKAIDTRKMYEGYMAATAERRARGVETIETLAYRTKKQPDPNEKRMFPGHYFDKLELPQKGDWDVDGPTRTDMKRSRFDATEQDTIPKGKNFTQDTWPYWNNAHHMIPKMTLVNYIDERTKTNPNIGLILKNQLLVAKYNINNLVNMIFLPQDMEVAKILGLPRHLALMVDGAPVKEPTDHKGYSAVVKSRLEPIISGYMAKYPKIKIAKEHPKAGAALEKEALEALSRQLFEQLKSVMTKDAAAGKQGLPLSEIAHLLEIPAPAQATS